jgi:hypothetical protein
VLHRRGDVLAAHAVNVRMPGKTGCAVMDSFRRHCDGYLVKPLDRARPLEQLNMLGLAR